MVGCVMVNFEPFNVGPKHSLLLDGFSIHNLVQFNSILYDNSRLPIIHDSSNSLELEAAYLQPKIWCSKFVNDIDSLILDENFVISL